MNKICHLALYALLLLSCGQGRPQGKDRDITISRLLEQAIEVGERYLSDRELIENVALTEGPDAALKLHDELRQAANYEAFWAFLKESDSIWMEVPDSAGREAIRSTMMPYLNHIVNLAEEINR